MTIIYLFIYFYLVTFTTAEKQTTNRELHALLFTTSVCFLCWGECKTRIGKKDKNDIPVGLNSTWVVLNGVLNLVQVG